VYRDRQFIRDARLSMTEIGLWADQYESGDMSASAVAAAAQRTASSIGRLGPADPSLERTRQLIVGMLTEYAKAVRIQHGDAGPHMYRAYGLANYAHGVLERAAGAREARLRPQRIPLGTLWSEYGSPGLLPEASVSTNAARVCCAIVTKA
jgi:hypothetical protein